MSTRSRPIGTFRALTKTPNHPARIARGENIIRNIPSDDATRSNDRPVSNRDTRANDRPAANPHVGTNADRFGEFEPFRPRLRFHGMRRGVNLNGRPEENIVPDSDLHHIQDDAIKIEKDFAPESDIPAVIAKEGWLDPGACFSSKELIQEVCAFLRLIFAGIIDGFEKEAAAQPFLH